MTNKEHLATVWAKRLTKMPAINECSIKGMEGPFQYPSGRVLFYDPIEGKYYDRGQDLYLTNVEAEIVVMNKNPLLRANIGGDIGG